MYTCMLDDYYYYLWNVILFFCHIVLLIIKALFFQIPNRFRSEIGKAKIAHKIQWLLLLNLLFTE